MWAVEEQVRLKDGTSVLVRPVRADDRELFVAGFERMSPESRYRRFMGHKQKLSERELDFFTRLDHDLHEAVGAIDVDSGEGVGVARMHRHPDDPSLAEAAVTIVDDWQGRGLGGLLLDRLVKRARQLGVTHFDASLFTSNKGMLTLFERLRCLKGPPQGFQDLTVEGALPGAPRG